MISSDYSKSILGVVDSVDVYEKSILKRKSGNSKYVDNVKEDGRKCMKQIEIDVEHYKKCVADIGKVVDIVDLQGCFDELDNIRS